MATICIKCLLTQEEDPIKVEIVVLSHATAGDFMEVVHNDHLQGFSFPLDKTLLGRRCLLCNLTPSLDLLQGENRKKTFTLLVEIKLVSS